MSNEEQLSGTTDKLGKVSKKAKEGLFLVKTKGYKEQFDNKQKALRAFDRMKSKKISNEESFKIELFEKFEPGEQWQLINESKIDKSFYQ